MKLYAIRLYDHAGRASGYLIGRHGPYTFSSKREAAKMALEHDQKNPTVNHIAEEIKD